MGDRNLPPRGGVGGNQKTGQEKQVVDSGSALLLPGRDRVLEGDKLYRVSAVGIAEPEATSGHWIRYPAPTPRTSRTPTTSATSGDQNDE